MLYLSKWIILLQGRTDITRRQNYCFYILIIAWLLVFLILLQNHSHHTKKQPFYVIPFMHLWTAVDAILLFADLQPIADRTRLPFHYFFYIRCLTEWWGSSMYSKSIPQFICRTKDITGISKFTKAWWYISLNSN